MISGSSFSFISYIIYIDTRIYELLLLAWGSEVVLKVTKKKPRISKTHN